MLRSKASQLLDRYRLANPELAKVFGRIIEDIDAGLTEYETDAWAVVQHYSQPQYLNHQAAPVAMLQVSMSSAFVNKQERTFNPRMFDMAKYQPVFSKSFRKMTISPRQFARTVCAGNAFAVGVYRDDHRTKANFILSQVIALDFDDAVSVDDLLQNKTARQFAGLIYPSPSSIPSYPKTRAVFFLDQPIVDAKEWERLQEVVINHFAAYSPDSKCKDCARFYFGSSLQGAVFLPKNTLPLDAIYALPEWAELRRREDDEKRARESASKFTGAVTDKSISGYSNAVMRTVSLAGAGERNDQLFRGALSVYKKRKEENWNISEAVLEQDLIRAAIANGLSNDDGHHSVIATIESARRRV